MAFLVCVMTGNLSRHTALNNWYFSEEDFEIPMQRTHLDMLPGRKEIVFAFTAIACDHNIAAYWVGIKSDRREPPFHNTGKCSGGREYDFNNPLGTVYKVQCLKKKEVVDQLCHTPCAYYQ